LSTETPAPSHIVIAALTASAEQLQNDDRAEAERRLLDIQDVIKELSQSATEKKEEATTEQQLQTHLLAAVLESETEVRNKSLELQYRISQVVVEIAKAQTNEAELNKRMRALEDSLNAARRQMDEHQARLRERERYLNDTSALSIFVSVVSLGLDRAGVAIQRDIEGDAQSMSNIQDELSRTVKEYYADQDQASREQQLLQALDAERQQYENAMADYKSKEASLYELEKAYRAKVVFLTDVALFYGKLAILVDNAQHRVQDVLDIVAELNDSTPRITDFDTSGQVLVSLKQALVRFDQLLLVPEPAGQR
jgi:uncharacterized protein YlxW (UPF0749 family)